MKKFILNFFSYTSIILFGCLFVELLKFFYDPWRCADGWDSPSIGKFGACSWHGGVGLIYWNNIGILTILILLSSSLCFKVLKRRKKLVISQAILQSEKIIKEQKQLTAS